MIPYAARVRKVTMTLAVLCYLIAAVLAVVSAFVSPPRVSLLSLALAAVAAGLTAEILT
jgi:hypothetical protein